MADTTTTAPAVTPSPSPAPAATTTGTAPAPINSADTAFSSQDQFNAAGGGSIVTVNPGDKIAPTVQYYKYANNPTVYSNSQYPTNPAPTKSPQVVSNANAAQSDLANKQTFLNNTSSAMTTQANNVATTNANNATAATTAQPVTMDDINNLINSGSYDYSSIGLSSTPPAGTTQTYDNTPAPDGQKYMYDSQGNRVAVPETPTEQANDIQSQSADAYQTFQNQVTQLQNGTFPLTSDQQAQVNALQAQFDQLKQQQQIANQNYTGGVTNAGIASGRARYAPEMELGNIQASVSAGLQKIAAIDAQAAQAISQLKAGFQSQNFQLINAAYTAATNFFQQKTDTLFKMSDEVRQEAQLQISKNQQALQEAQFEDQKTQAALKFASDNQITKPFYLLGNTAINTKTGEPVSLSEYQQLTGQQVGLPESQTDFSQIQSSYTTPADRSAAEKEREFNITEGEKQREFNITNANSSPGNTTTVQTDNGGQINLPTILVPYYNQSANGVGYIDATTLQGTSKDKTGIINAATQAGLKVITNKNEAADLTNIKDVFSKLDTIESTMSSIDQPSALSRDLGGLGLTKFAQMAQTDPQKAAAGVLNSVGLDVLKAISGVQGFRGNQSAIQQVKSELPSIYDTKDTVAAKLNNLRTLIGNREDAIVGSGDSSSNSNVQTMSDGSQWQQNADGSYTRIK